MALTIANWARASVSANEPITTLTGGTIVGCFREYNYYTADTQATVSASGYFNASVAYAGVSMDIVTGDYVDVYSTTDDTLVKYRLTNTAGVVTSTIIDGSVQVSTTMTATQFNAMNVTPFQILPAPGAGRAYQFLGGMLSLVYGGTQFANGGVIGFQYGNTAQLAGVECSGTFVAATWAALTASTIVTLLPVAVNSAVANIANQGIFISNETAPFINGTSATVIVSVSANIVRTA
jgi:hypothetical protein